MERETDKTAQELIEQTGLHHDPSEFMDGLALGNAEQERATAKAWVRTAAQHCRNEEYWRDRAKIAEAKLILDGTTELGEADLQDTDDFKLFVRAMQQSLPDDPSEQHSRHLAERLRRFDPVLANLLLHGADTFVAIREHLHKRQL